MIREIKQRICEFVHEGNSTKALCKNQIESCSQLIRLCDVARIMNQVESEYEPKADWIPCEERLPIIEEEPSEYAHDIGERYLITDSEGYVYESTFWKGQNDFEDYAIAWMPKPQPYKKEGAEDECN